MRVVLLHSFYQQRGGEDAVVESELALLRRYGHDVTPYFRSNDVMSTLGKPAALLRTTWSQEDRRAVSRLLAEVRPDVLHVHNTFQAVSPSILWAAAEQGVPVVQTLHNFRLICPQAMLLRHDRVCEDCIGHVPWRGVVRACYRESRVQTAALVSMLMLHRGLGSYGRHVARFIALSEFSKVKLVEGGLDPARICVKPNFYEGSAMPKDGPRERGLFVGRLSREKGVEVLLGAARDHGMRGIDVIGDGEAYAGAVREVFGPAAKGFLPSDAVMTHMQSAAFLVVPSICYENFPRAIVEAFACGVPVIASAMGAMAEIV